jgi:dihydrofolate reductase
MGRLIYSMIVSLDGYVSDPEGQFDLAGADEEMHTFVDEVFGSVGTYLYGRRMYETMVYWETADVEPDQPQFVVDYARGWQAADKIVYSSTLADVSSARTRLERTFDVDAARSLKAEAERDLTIAGPELASHAIRAGLVDEIALIVAPVVVGGGTPFFPDDVHADLELIDQRTFGNGVVFVRYSVVKAEA